ncbi:PSD1 and planctomycete cytochrome C domain-containing protein [Fuerstiella marisgermanici]|uniref:Planctomycete cytochrome C n=1 Tax=Fuerstiella marisgermanici TaxID=1891926 RepID=A0A1P8WGG4_9PLAN|nr:PSD1 and planctomycete cytochrome C domain-containing protein [Fuerstiella marisgermanici]APZ93145.1 Planctomycete cytochrome C [Fuerstiella marisgermanici]
MIFSMRRFGRACFHGSLLLFALSLVPAEIAAQQLSYNRDVRPILAENCFSCHGFDHATREAGLRLDTREGAVAALESGNIGVVPGKPDDSELVRRILSDDDDLLMPPPHSGKHLSPEQKNILIEWIAQEANYQPHWAFIPPQKVEPPAADSDVTSIKNPIDAFIQERLQREGLSPSPLADPMTLIRRLSLDLTGLPPTVPEVDDFAAAFDANPDLAYSQLTERLLQSAAYGERWGRWWLDQARYADSNGYSIDAPRSIWKYRDWVVDSLNQDLPFDRFTVEQLAGDLLPNAAVPQLVATGFHRNTQINQEGGIDPEQYRIDSVFDRVATTGTVWLGLSIGCAQCHDHKFDPITQREYYQFFAFLNNQDEPSLTVYDPEIDVAALRKERKQLQSALRTRVDGASDQLDAWESQLGPDERKALSKDIQKALSTKKAKRNTKQLLQLFGLGPGQADQEFLSQQQRLAEIERALASGVSTLVMKERTEPRKTTVFIKGDFTRPAEEVTSGTPAVLPALSTDSDRATRLDLANWIVSAENPLTARVIVNRVWQQYFGRGLVETENDFGLQGTTPSHPELLDWLAVNFVEQGWSLKALHRTIVTSHTYQQSSRTRSDLQAKDPDNILLARQRRLRLDAEIVRDVALSVSGLLSRKMGGPPVYPPIPEGVMGQGQVKRSWTVSVGEDRYRRGLYTFVYRATPPPSLSVFDAPDGLSTCTRRNRSNTPLQALTLMNDANFFEFAKSLADVIQRDGIETAFRRCTSRFPRQEERKVLEGLSPLNAARTLLNLDETYTRE